MTPEEHYAEAERLISAGYAVVREIREIPPHRIDTEVRRDALGKQAMGIWAQAQVHATLATRIVPVELSPVLVSDVDHVPDPLSDSGPENIPDFIQAKVSPTSAADPADLAAEKPAAAATPDVVAAGTNDRRESVRLCGTHWQRLKSGLTTERHEAGIDAVVGLCSFLAGPDASELFDYCPVCFLNARGGTTIYVRLIDLAVSHVLEQS